jgi:putative lipoprotein
MGCVVAAGCGGDAETKSDAGVPEHERLTSVFRDTWNLTRMGDRTFTTGAPQLEFDVKQGRFAGFSGCNRMMGGYRVDGSQLAFSQIGGTLMVCTDPDATRIEAEFTKALEQTTRFDQQADQVRLFAGDQLLLTFAISHRDRPTAQPVSKVTGTVTYRQRIALAPDAVLEVKLLDVSRADAPSETIASQEIQLEGRQVPISFEVQYDPTHIDPNNRYTIQARILAGGQLHFISQQAYPVLTHGNPSNLEVIVGPAR